MRSGSNRVGGIDEVGRGSLAGPLTLALVVVDAATQTAPVGTADSKTLSSRKRESLVPLIRRWSWSAVVSIDASIIDTMGISHSMSRGIDNLLQVAKSEEMLPASVILDGLHNFYKGSLPVNVITKIKADSTCSSVAAASVLAKVERDAFMTTSAEIYPSYGWDRNSGYGTLEHRRAIDKHGLTPLHRRSFQR